MKVKRRGTVGEENRREEKEIETKQNRTHSWKMSKVNKQTKNNIWRQKEEETVLK